MHKSLPAYRRGSALIFVLIALLFVAGLAAAFYFGKNYFKTSAPTATNSATTNSSTDETANWKTYASDKGGFTVKYPPDWGIGHREMDNLYSDKVSLGQGVSGSGESSDFDIYVQKNENSTGLPYKNAKEVVERALKNVKGAEGFVDGKIEQITLNGKIAYKLTYKLTDSIKFVRIFVTYVVAVDYNNQIYIIESMGGQEPRFFNEILSTFKFTD